MVVDVLSICDTEREHYIRAIRDAGLGLDDFELTVEYGNEKTDEVFAITGLITVRRLSNDSVQFYAADHGSNWLAEFAQDLVDGFFG